MINKSKTPRRKVRYRHDLHSRQSVLDLSIIQGPLSVAPCLTITNLNITNSQLLHRRTGGDAARAGGPQPRDGLPLPALHRARGARVVAGRLPVARLDGGARGTIPRRSTPTPYSDEQVANRDIRVWHGATKKWSLNDGQT